MGTSVKTEEYNGTSWATVNDMVAHKREGEGAGTQTAGWAAGGNPAGQQQVTHEYDGTSWTVGGTMVVARNNNACWGSLTAGITAGAGNYSATAEEYDGSSWSAVDNMPAGKGLSPGLGAATGGTSGIMHGGINDSGILDTTYEYSQSLTARTISNS